MNKEIRDGYIKPELQEKDWIFGSNQLGGTILCEDGQWIDYLPEYEPQEKNFDTANCTGLTTCNVVEIKMKRKLYGKHFNYSDRVLGILAGTYPPGNSPQTVAETARKKGLCRDELLPFENVSNVDDYYDARKLTLEILNECENWKKEWTLKHDIVGNFTYKIPPEMLMEALKYSPLGVAVYAWVEENGIYKRYEPYDTHWTVMVGYKLNEYWLIYDSYEPHLKKLDWDFGFTVVKRYYIEKNIPEPLGSELLEMLKNIVQSLILIVKNAYGKITGAFK